MSTLLGTPRFVTIDVEPGDDIVCERCGKAIKNQYVWLELNCSTNEWTTLDKPWPEEYSQGCFQFGLECVSKALNGIPFKGRK